MGRKRKADSIPDFSLKLEGGEDGQPLAKDAREDDPAQRNTANARERDRMRVLSKAFTKLKTTLPWVPPDTKLSKLDTLKLASCYIAHLRQILDEDNTENSPVMAGIATRNLKSNSNLHPMTLTWPFTFNGRTSVCDNGYDTGTKSMSVNKHS